MEGSSVREAIANVRSHLWPVLKANWTLWPITQVHDLSHPLTPSHTHTLPPDSELQVGACCSPVERGPAGQSGVGCLPELDQWRGQQEEEEGRGSPLATGSNIFINLCAHNKSKLYFKSTAGI